MTSVPCKFRVVLAILAILAVLVTSPANAQDPGDCAFAPDRSMSMTGEGVTFTLVCPDVPSHVAWDFGDGTRLDSGALSSRHVFSRAGHYLVAARAEGHPFLVTRIHNVGEVPTALPPAHSSALIYDRGRRRVYVVNPDHHTAAAIDVAARRRVWEVPVGRNPRTLALDSAGNIWVACQDEAAISVLDGDDGRLLRTIALPYASRPYGLAFAPGTNRAYVTLEATGRLLQLDGATRAIVAEADLGVRARALAITADGRILAGRFISPADRGEVVEATAEPSGQGRLRVFPLAMDPGPDNEANSRGVPNAISSIAVSPDGRWAWVASKKDNVERGRLRNGEDLTAETTVRSIVSQIDLVGNRESLPRRKDFNDQSLPSALAFTRASGYAFVAHSGSNNVAVIDTWSGANVFSLEAEGPEADRAPEGLALDPADSLLFVLYFLSREVAVFDVSRIGVDNTRVRKIAAIATSDHEPLSAEVLRGKRVFYNAADPRMSKDRYNSCVVCHMDGATDGRVWDFTQRGEGLRRTASLLGRAGTGQGPVHWSANFDEIQDFEHDIRGPFGGTGFLGDADFNAGTRSRTLGDRKAGLSRELDDLSAYVASLTRAHPSPYRSPDGSLTADGLAGKAVFNRPEVGCATCHSGPHFTDSQRRPRPDSLAGGLLAFPGGFLLHDVGTLKPSSGRRLNDTLPGLDTPTLKGIWEFPPYLHDGSAPTLMDVITTANPFDRHGQTSSLDQEEKRQLVAYLQQLDEGENPAVAARPVPRTPPAGLRLSVLAGAGGGTVAFRVEGAPAGYPLSLSIHRPDGALVKSLGDGGGNAGPDRLLSWNGLDGSGRLAGPGLYLLRAGAGPYRAQGRFTRIRSPP